MNNRSRWDEDLMRSAAPHPIDGRDHVRTKQLILAHEAPHVDTGDRVLLAIACGLVALMPWNPAL
jgi:beta-lactamase regulating signal transducer with metallopeptidase domain